MKRFAVVLSGVLLALSTWVGACVETYDDTRIEANLTVGPGLARDFLILPTPGLTPGDPRYYSHYELFANIDDAGWVRLSSFIIQPAVHVDHPCLQFIPDTFCIDDPAAPLCDPFINMDRFANLQNILGVVSVAPTVETSDATNIYGFKHCPGYNFLDLDCFPPEIFIDPNLPGPGARLARLNLDPLALTDFCSALPSGHYVGNPAQLTLPRNGTLLGTVDGTDPRTGGSIGGITLRVPGKLSRVTEILITRERDPGRLAADTIDRADMLPGPDSQAFLVGRRDESYGFIRDDELRGVLTAQLVSPYALPITMHLAIYENIDEDPIQF